MYYIRIYETFIILETGKYCYFIFESMNAFTLNTTSCIGGLYLSLQILNWFWDTSIFVVNILVYQHLKLE